MFFGLPPKCVKGYFLTVQEKRGEKISFAGIITGAEYGASLGEVQVINISFITSGTITSAI